MKAADRSEPVPLHPEYWTQNRVYYMGLPKTFIAGTVVNKATDECFEGADVTLKDIATGKEMKAKTNNYGDFEFEGLDSGKVYSLKIESAGYSPITKDTIALNTDTYLGDLFLSK
jgi:hypothetical protein